MSPVEIIIIAGPTGVGKTDISIQVAKKLDGEIISADSMQIYKGMDIGTAKIKEEEMQGVQHHLIDVVSPFDSFTVYDFQKLAIQRIFEINSRGRKPIIVGGTGLYINSILYEMDFNNVSEDLEYRKYLWEIYEQKGMEFLFNMLIDFDPDTKIEKENIKRVIRALEIIKSKKNLGEFTKINHRKEVKANLYILNRERKELYENINKRVDIMIEDGLLDEVKKLYDMGLDENYQSMKAIGYSQILKTFSGEYSFDEAVEKIKQESRRYAKRQITWFKRYDEAFWQDLTNNTKAEIINNIK